MSNPETKAAHSIRRKVLSETVGRILYRSETIEVDTNGLHRFEELVGSGFGGIIILKHFSLKDPPQVLKDIVIASKVLRQKEVAIPNAKHQIYPGTVRTGGFFGVRMDPVVTERTVEKAKKKKKPIPVLNEGAEEFRKNALSYLKRGQLVAIAPEGTRKADLDHYNNNSIGALLGAVKIARARVAVLFVDERLAGKKEGYWDKNGWNFLRKYETRIGRCLTDEEVIDRAGGKLRDVDEKVVIPEMRYAAGLTIS